MRVIRLDHGKANALDLELLGRMDRELQQAQGDDSVVLTASGSIFSAGIDLFRLVEGGAGYANELLHALDQALIRLYDFPRPVVAAINGHAIAGGCIIACACDVRIMVRGDARIGLTELLVGVPFPSIPLEIVRSVIPPVVLRRIIYEGGTYESEEALKLGLVDELVPAAELMARATAVAQKLGSIAPAAFTLTKRRLHSDLAEVKRRYAREEEEVRRIWADPRTRAHIENYINTTMRKSQ